MTDLKSELDQRVEPIHARGDALEQVVSLARRRRRRRRIGSAVLGVAVAVAGSVALFIAFEGGGRAPGHSPTPSPSATQVEASPIPGTEVIDPAAHEVFAPAPATARPRLSAEEAWALFARRIHSHVTTIPANVTVRLGLLTFPIGPIGPGGSMEYHAKNLLVYGFSAPICGPRTHPVPAPNSTVSPPTESFGTCTFWYFLDANTARVIDQTTQYRH